MDRRKSSVVSHKRSSRTSTISRGRSSLIGGKRVSVMDPTMDLDLENNPRLMETRPSKTEPQKPTRRSSRSSKLSKDSVASVMQPYQYTPDSSDQTLVRVARYRFGFLYEKFSSFSNFFLRIMYPLDVPSPGSQESIAPNRFAKFDREHAFFTRLRFSSPCDYIWTKILIW